MFRKFQFLIRCIVVVAVVAPLAYLGWNWSAFPASVPSHFGVDGRPDAWGPKPMLLLLPVITVVIVSALSIGKRFPHRFNFPVKLTDENRGRLTELGVQLLETLRLFVAVMLSVMSIQQMRTALGLADGLGVGIIGACVGGILGAVALFLVKTIRAR